VRVTVLYFAAAREQARLSGEPLELPEGATAAQALEAACALHPGLRAIAGQLRVAVDQEFAPLTAPLRDGAEVALIPPVAGGAQQHRISAAPLDPEGPLRAVEGKDCGAVVSFAGVVRSSTHGKEVTGLAYEAYEPMALKIFEQIEQAALVRFSARVCIHHRTGELLPGELSVVIAAASPHRASAFEACRYAIEQLKTDAPIWKRESYPDGSSWVGLGS
jgi:molybdopterin converting factor subunit 1